MPKSGKDEHQKESSELGRFDVLDGEGRKTMGLSGKSSIKVKGLKNYKVSVQPAMEPQLIPDVQGVSQSIQTLALNSFIPA